MDTRKRSTRGYNHDPDHRVAVKLILDFVGPRPFGMSDDEYITSIICAVVGGVMEQTILFLDKHPKIVGVEDKTQLREHIMNGVTIAVTEQLCAVWKFSGQKREALPPFVKMMAALFEEAEASKDWESSPYAPNVGDIGHA
jgi:hypothetical protein